jgi:hypothetical protein
MPDPRPRRYFGVVPPDLVGTLHTCGPCAHAGDHKKERQVAYCLHYRIMVPTMTPSDCRHYVRE